MPLCEKSNPNNLDTADNVILLLCECSLSLYHSLSLSSHFFSSLATLSLSFFSFSLHYSIIVLMHPLPWNINRCISALSNAVMHRFTSWAPWVWRLLWGPSIGVALAETSLPLPPPSWKCTLTSCNCIGEIRGLVWDRMPRMFVSAGAGPTRPLSSKSMSPSRPNAELDNSSGSISPIIAGLAGTTHVFISYTHTQLHTLEL